MKPHEVTPRRPDPLRWAWYAAVGLAPAIASGCCATSPAQPRDPPDRARCRAGSTARGVIAPHAGTAWHGFHFPPGTAREILVERDKVQHPTACALTYRSNAS